MKLRIRTLAAAAALIASSTLSIGQTSTGTVPGTTASPSTPPTHPTERTTPSTRPSTQDSTAAGKSSGTGTSSEGTTGSSAEAMQMCKTLSGAQERQDCMQRARNSSKGEAKDSPSGTHSNPSGTSGGKWSGDKSGTTDSSQQDRGSSGDTSATSSGSKR